MQTHNFFNSRHTGGKTPLRALRVLPTLQALRALRVLRVLRGGIAAAAVSVLFLGAAAFTPLAAQESFFDEESGGESASESSGESLSSLSWSGELNFTTRSFPGDRDDFDSMTDDYGDSDMNAWPELRFDAEYEADNSEVVGSLEYSSAVEVTNAEELINEAYLTLYYDRFDLSAGYMKEVWGTADGVHAVDVLNPIDYSDFVLPDYLDRNIAEKMMKANIYVGGNGTLELALVPLFHPHQYPTEGRWKPYRLTEMEEKMEKNPLVNYDAITTDLEEENTTQKLSEGQYGLRYSDSAGGFDYGFTYYFGFDRTPVIDSVESTADYNRLNLFGLETATVVSGFNLRAEAAYRMTEDYDGDDPLVHNHRVEYVAGFDKTLPLSNLTFQLQGVGSYILKNNNIEEPVEPDAELIQKINTGQVEPEPMDNEYDPDGDYSSNTITARLSDSYANNTINPEIRMSYNVEKEDYMIVPELELVLRDDATLTLSSTFFEGDEAGEFGQYDGNDFFEAEFSYSF